MNNKFCIFPINDLTIWKMYKQQINSFWTPEEIDFSNDYKDFMTLDENIKNSIKMILAFFSNSDGLVNFNIQNNFLADFSKEINFTYVFQMFMEQIHNETYSIMIETLINDDKLFDSLNNIQIINDISKWGVHYSNDLNISLSEKLLVFICFEAIMFSGAFAFIFWLKKICSKKLFMSGLIKSNEFISRDEGMHVDFGVHVFKKQNQVDNLHISIVQKIILEAVELTKNFNKDVLNVNYAGMNHKLMNQYTEYMADRVFVMLNYDKYFKVNNPFSFMDTIGMMQRTNFHESNPTEYQRPYIGGNNINVQFLEDF